MNEPGVVIELSQRRLIAPGRFEVEVRVGPDAPITVTVDDPGDSATEALFSWYFEKLPESAYPRKGHQPRAEERLRDYGRELFQRAFGTDRVVRALEPYRRRGFSGCRLLISGEMEFHRLHWEAMRDPDLDEPLSVKMPFQRGIRDRRIVWQLGGSRPSLNVLVVAARPYGADDLDYRSITRVLLAELWNAEQPVRVDVVRPRTWRALGHHLREHENTYQVIHFDLHGTVGVAAELMKDAPGSPGEGGRLRMSVQPGAEAGRETAFLLFEADEPGVADLVPAKIVADLLAQHHIPVAVLNSCRSAMFPDGDASLAQWLAKYGVQVVVGMAYAVTPVAVTKAMPIFYRAISRGESPAEAVRRSRAELLAEPERSGPEDRRLNLQDWIVPVVYQQLDRLDLDLRPMTAAERDAYFSSHSEAGQEPLDVTGRDFDLLAVERLLFSGEGGQVILIHGAAGVGKTAFATRLLKWWWLRTGLVEGAAVVISIGDELMTARDIVHRIAESVLDGADLLQFHADAWRVQMPLVASRLRSRQHLVIIDSGASGLADRRELHHFLRLVADGKSLVVVTSRTEEADLAAGTFRAKRYRLEPPLSTPSPRRIEKQLDPVPPARSKTAIVAGTAGAAALAVVVGLQLLLPEKTPPPTQTMPSTTAAAGPTTTAAAAPTPTADPDWLTGPPAPGLTIESPTAGQTTKACVDMRGTATRLSPEQTVLVALRKVQSEVGDDFFYYRASLAGSEWSVSVNVGTGNFQDYKLYALVADRRSAERAWQVTDGLVTSRVPIAGLRRGADVRVHQLGRC